MTKTLTETMASEQDALEEAGLEAAMERLERIGRRLAGQRRAEAELGAQGASRDKLAEEFETAFQGLSRRLADAAGRRDRGARPHPFAAAAKAVAERANERRGGDFRLGLNELSRALDNLAPRTSVEAVESALRDLEGRVEAQENRNIEDSVLLGLEHLASELRSIVTERDSSAVLRELQAEVKAVNEKLANAPSGAVSPVMEDLAMATREIRDFLSGFSARGQGFEKLDASLSELAARVADLSLGRDKAERFGGLDAIRAAVGEEASGAFRAFEERLAGKIDGALASSVGVPERFDEINRRIDQLHGSLIARMEGDAVQRVNGGFSGAALARKLHGKLDGALVSKLVAKIDKLEKRLHQPISGAAFAKIEALLAQPPHSKEVRELAERIDFVCGELTERIEGSARLRSDHSARLAELVEQLIAKIDAALEVKADASAFSSLEQRVDGLSRRVDESGGNAAALVSMEGRVKELFAKIDETRAATAQAAERAVRDATEEMLREASGSSMREAFEKELQGLRRAQDENGERMGKELAALNEALERLEGRFASSAASRSSADEKPAVAPEASSRARAETIDMAARMASSASAAVDLDAISFSLGGGRAPEPSGGAIEAGAGADAGRIVQVDFIAAARRAAEQDGAGASAPRGSKRAADAKRREKGASVDAGVRAGSSAFLAGRRLALVSVGTLALTIGVVRVAQIARDLPAQVASSTQSGDGASGDGRVAVTDFAVTNPSAPAGDASQRQMAFSEFSSPNIDAEQLAAQGQAADTTPVGSIDRSADAPHRIALEAIKTLAAMDDPAAQYELATRYMDGRGVDHDPKAAAQLFEKAAKQGLAIAQYRLGSLYEKGLGVERDYAKARKWYKLGATHGNAKAMHNLAVLFAGGAEGKPDYAAAAPWLRKAAELGVRDSQFNLAVLYARGLGVERNMEQSYVWFAAAAAQGDDEAAKKRDEVAARLNAKALASAKALLEKFRPKQPERGANEAPEPAGGWENVKTPPKEEKRSDATPRASLL